MIPNDVIDVLRQWYTAHNDAKDNPQRMIDARGAEECTRVTNECAERMRVCGVADEAFWKLAERPAEEVPPLVRLYIDAENDKGCAHCWLSSCVMKNHPECQFKISRWFGYREACMAYVREVYVRHYRRA